jgi:ubiquinone/menaquinone biosynthesis C-methylase UbiE/DNA-directed RNA polymerase subunit N (RpoN/RPB10)
MSSSQHDHYDHYSKEMIFRLDGFFGLIDEKINSSIRREAVDLAVLDIGCGFGSLVEHLRNNGIQARGIDMQEFGIRAGKERFPNAQIEHHESGTLPFADKSFDTVVLKDTLHHIYGESDIAVALQEIKRVCKKRVIISDPNPTAILLICRKLIGHVDPVCSPKDAIRVLEMAGFQVKKVQYSEVFAFPLSGGYVGREFVPRYVTVYKIIISIEWMLQKTISFLGLSKYICWRYLISADIAEALRV